jgi:hypothetical protein
MSRVAVPDLPLELGLEVPKNLFPVDRLMG